MMASAKPRSSITRASSVYLTRLCLGSPLVTPSRHRYGRCPLITTQARMARMASATTPDAIIGIGWSKGMASQVSLPSIGEPRQCSTNHARRRARGRRYLLRRDRLEQVRIGQAVDGLLVLHRRLGDLLIAVLVKRLVGLRAI